MFMRKGTTAPLAAFVVMALAGFAPAQFDVNGPNAVLTIAGTAPSAADPTGHTVDIGVPGDLTVAVTSGANPTQGFILVAGALNAGSYGVPWGGSVDLGTPNPPFTPTGISVVMDGVFFSVGTPLNAFAVTPFQMSVSIAATAGGQSGPGLQAIVSDPSAPPFFFDNTEAGLPNYVFVTVTDYATLADDSFVLHQLDQTNGVSPIAITYGGVAYSQVYIGSNGMVTFVDGSTDFIPTISEVFNGWAGSTVSPTPGVALAWQDMARGSAVGDLVRVTENLATSEVTVEFINQQHWDSQTPSGTFSCSFGGLGPDSIVFDHTGFIVGNPGVDAGPIVGVTDGTGGVGTDRTADLSVDIAAFYSTTAAPESIAEDFNATVISGGSLDIGVWTALNTGGAGFNWTLF